MNYGRHSGAQNSIAVGFGGIIEFYHVAALSMVCLIFLAALN